MGAPLVTLRTKSGRPTRVVRVESGGIAPSKICLWIGVRPCRAVADVASGFHDVLSNAVGRFLYRDLILFRTRHVGKLFEVGHQ